MIYAIFATAVLILAALFCVIILQYRQAAYNEIVISQIKDQLTQWVTAPDANTPSPLASFVDRVGQTMGRSIAACVLQRSSAEQRQLQGLERDIAADQLEAQNPMLSSLAGMLGKRTSKRLFSNPMLLQAVSALFQRFAPTGSGPGPTTPVGSNHHEGAFRIE